MLICTYHEFPIEQFGVVLEDGAHVDFQAGDGDLVGLGGAGPGSTFGSGTILGSSLGKRT